MSDPDPANSADSAVGQVVESFLDRFRRGERPALTELMKRHPELADQLLEIIPALVELEQLGGAAGSPSGPRTGGGAAIEAIPPEVLGDYKILRRIGGGGMGVVYEAEHESLKSRVALKVMHPRFRADEKYLRRFHVEARSAAALHHTNIVSVFDYGEQGGVCYYAMQYIRGQPLDGVLADLRQLRANVRDPNLRDDPSPQGPPEPPTQRSAANGLLTGRFLAGGRPEVEVEATLRIKAPSELQAPTIDRDSGAATVEAGEPLSFASSSLGGGVERRYYREVARVGAQVADALDYAHRAGVLHRDIKPPNLLLDALGNVWVTDFGLAKLIEGDDISQSQDLVGTLRYMAPERFRGISGRGGDIYALGATLYELLTLRPAFDGSDQVRLIDRIVHEPPQGPRSIDGHVPRDLETIVLKALAKDPKDRFGSARELAEELRKFVDGHPILSRPITVAERFYRWCRRNPWLAAANIAAAATTIALAGGSAFAAKYYYDSRERLVAIAKDLEKSETVARQELFDSKASQARASRYSRQPGQRFESLEAIADAVKIGRELRLPAGRFDRLRDEAIASLMLPDLKVVGPKFSMPEGAFAIDFDDELARYACRREDGTIFVRRTADDREVARFAAKGTRETHVFMLSPDGRYLATRDGETISVWDVDRSSVAWTVPGPCQDWAATFSPDSRRIAVAPRDGTVLVRDLETGRLSSSSGPGELHDMAFRPDGRELAVTCSRNPVICRILDPETGRLLRSISAHVGRSIAWSPDGSTLAFGSEGDEISVVDATKGDLKSTFAVNKIGSMRIGFHTAGTLLASNGWETRLRLWDPATGQERLSFSFGSGREGASSSFSRDGRMVIYHGVEFSPILIEPAVEYSTLSHPSNRPMSYARTSIHRDGRVLSVGTDRGVILWDLARKAELGFLPIGLAWHSIFEPSGDLLTNATSGLMRWPVRADPAGGKIRIGPPRILIPGGTDSGVAVDETSRVVARAARSHVDLLVGDRLTKIGGMEDCRGVEISPDGKWLTAGNYGKTSVTVWSLPDATKVITVPTESSAVTASFVGKWLVHSRSSCRVLEVGSWREVRRFEGSLQGFSPDGRLVIVRDQGNILRLVEVETGRLLAKFERPDQRSLSWLSFSPDGSRLVGTSNDPPSAQVIDLRLIRRRLAAMGLDWDAPAFPEHDAASPDLPPLPPIEVDYGFMTQDLEHFSDDPATVAARHSERIERDPGDFEAYHHRAHALADQRKFPEAIADISRAILLRPDEAHFLTLRGLYYFQHDPAGPEKAILDLERATKLDPSRDSTRRLLARFCNDLAWQLARKTPTGPDLDRALRLSQRSIELFPDTQENLNTRGLVLYRAGRYADAVKVLDASLVAGRGELAAFDLYFLAMCHHRLGHREEARHRLDLAAAWMSRRVAPTDPFLPEFNAFRLEAEAVLAGPAGEPPGDASQQAQPR